MARDATQYSDGYEPTETLDDDYDIVPEATAYDLQEQTDEADEDQAVQHGTEQTAMSDLGKGDDPVNDPGLLYHLQLERDDIKIEVQAAVGDNPEKIDEVNRHLAELDRQLSQTSNFNKVSDAVYDR